MVSVVSFNSTGGNSFFADFFQNFSMSEISDLCYSGKTRLGGVFIAGGGCK